MRRVTRMAIAVLPAFVLAGCINLGHFGRVEDDFHYTYAMQPGGRLNFENRNGTVEIAGWDRNTIDVSGTKYASSRDSLQEVQVNVKVEGNDASVSTTWPSVFGGNYGAKFLIRVPRMTSLERTETTNGSISVEDLQGGGKLHSSNGRITLTRDTGDYEAHTTNASIEFDECSGSMRGETTNGGVRGRLTQGTVDARSTNGSVDLTLLKPLDGQTIRGRTTNGGVNLALAEFRNNTISAETTHGGIVLRLPENTNAHLTANTSMSNISTELNVSGSVDASKHHLSGNLGNGGPLISAHTSMGRIRIEKY